MFDFCTGRCLLFPVTPPFIYLFFFVGLFDRRTGRCLLFLNSMYNSDYARSYLFAFCSSTSLLVLYTASTLYHSFFALMVTRYVFEVLDKCAIYILIAGSYTPYLQICLHDKPKWSIYLLAFIWLCAIMGVGVEACFPAWKHKPKFSLSMYLGMGWACMVCMPDLIGVVPPITLYLVVMGGVAYTGGVPFFVRNNNLDHSVWHLFVLAGSVFHWFGVYIIAK